MSSTIGDSIRRRRGLPRPHASGPRLRWWRVILLSLAAAALAFGAGYALAVLFLFPAPALSAPGIVVPRLIGQDTGSAARALADRRLRLGSVTEVPDPSATAGTIVAQDALAGQQLRAGAPVNVAVSGGAVRAMLPNLKGYAAARAVALLTDLGFQVTQVQAQTPVAAGHVADMNPIPGIAYDLPAQVTLTISTGPPPDTTTVPADSATADSLGVMPGQPAPPPEGGQAAPTPGAGAPPGARPGAPPAPVPGAGAQPGARPGAPTPARPPGATSPAPAPARPTGAGSPPPPARTPPPR